MFESVCEKEWESQEADVVGWKSESIILWWGEEEEKEYDEEVGMRLDRVVALREWELFLILTGPICVCFIHYDWVFLVDASFSFSYHGGKKWRRRSARLCNIFLVLHTIFSKVWSKNECKKEIVFPLYIDHTIRHHFVPLVTRNKVWLWWGWFLGSVKL